MAETRLLLGDCVDLLPEIKSSSIDLIIIDPPYSTPIVTAFGRERMSFFPLVKLELKFSAFFTKHKNHVIIPPWA